MRAPGRNLEMGAQQGLKRFWRSGVCLVVACCCKIATSRRIGSTRTVLAVAHFVHCALLDAVSGRLYRSRLREQEQQLYS
jgi:hypothetical protein